MQIFLRKIVELRMADDLLAKHYGPVHPVRTEIERMIKETKELLEKEI